MSISAHILILGRAEEMAKQGAQAAFYAGFAAAMEHHQVSGYQDWAAERAILATKLADGDPQEIDTQLGTLHDMLPE